MYKFFAVLSVLAVMIGSAIYFLSSVETESQNAAGKNKTVYNFTMKDIDGNDVKLKQYKGKVLLIVNTASKCGYTPQYEGLETIYEKYEDQGLTILGFPANNFGGQEPGKNEEIKEFCESKYKVTFPMFAKISVKGDDQDPLYQYLTDKDLNPKFGGEISWNFNKFLIDRKGNIVARFTSKDTPESEQVTSAIEKYLSEK